MFQNLKKMGAYYFDISWEAFKRMLTRGAIIILLFKGFLIFILPFLIGTFAVEDLWTIGGFSENWFWVLGPFLFFGFLFWLPEALIINYENVEIIKPKLKVEYLEGEQSYQQWDPDSSNPQFKLHRIKISNLGKQTIKGVYVQISSIAPLPIGGIRGLPIDLHVMGRDSEQIRNDPIFDLPGESEKFIDVISLGRREYNSNNLIYPAGSYPNAQSIYLGDDQNYDINISVFADGTKYCDKTFCLHFIEDQNHWIRHKFSELYNSIANT